MTDFGKLLVLIGGLLVLAGVAVMLIARSGLPLGKLPGDITYRGKNTIVYFPLATSILLRVVLSLVLYGISRFRKLAPPPAYLPVLECPRHEAPSPDRSPAGHGPGGAICPRSRDHRRSPPSPCPGERICARLPGGSRGARLNPDAPPPP